MRKLLASILFVLSAQNAFAAITYQWQTIAPGDRIISAIAEITVTDAAVQSGSISYGLPPVNLDQCPYCFVIDPLSPIEHFYFTAVFENGYHDFEIDLYPTQGMVFMYPNYWLDVSLSFANPGIPSGTILVNDTISSVQLSSDQNLWTVDRWGTDGGACGECSGVTGIFHRIPEPTTLALLLIAPFVMLFRWRRLPRRQEATQ